MENDCNLREHTETLSIIRIYEGTYILGSINVFQVVDVNVTQEDESLHMIAMILY